MATFREGTPMASRRVRRHNTGITNKEDQQTSAQGSDQSSVRPATSLGGTKEVTLILADRLYKAPSVDRDGPFQMTLNADRHSMYKILHKLHHSAHNEIKLQKVFHSLDPKVKGTISTHDMRAALDRLNFGLSNEEKERVLQQLDPKGTGQVSYDKFMHRMEDTHPLGDDKQTAKLRESYGVIPAPWQKRTRGFRKWNAPARGGSALPGVSDSAADGSYEQQAEDAFLLHLVANKIHQHRDKLCLVFRTMDSNKNSRIEKLEFVSAIQKLRMSISKKQIERLFEIADKDHSGQIDYQEFMRAFDGEAKPRIQPKEHVPAGKTLAEAFDVSAEDIHSTLREPLVRALQQRLYSKASSAHRIFKQYDVNGDGYLSVDELTKCCQTIVPGIEKKHITSMMVHIDSSGDGYLNYKEFIGHLADRAAPHTRMLEAELAREARGEDDSRSTWGDSPLRTRPLSPTASTSILSLPTSTLGTTANSLASGSCISQHTCATMDTMDRDALHAEAVSPVLKSLALSEHALSQSLPDLRGISARYHASSDVSRSLDSSPLQPRPWTVNHTSTTRVSGPADTTTYSSSFTTSLSSPPSHASSRSTRFWYQKYPDTSYVTQVDPDCASYASSSSSFIRKGDHSFMEYQQEDKERKQRHAEVCRQQTTELLGKTTERRTREEKHSEEETRLKAKAEAIARYNQRQALYDESFHAQHPSGTCTLFGRLGVYDQTGRPAINR